MPLAAEVVEHVGGRAVARVEHAAVAHPAVVGRVPPGEQELAGDEPQAPLDELPRQLRLQVRLVDDGAGLLEQPRQRRRVVGDADLLEQAHGLLVHELLLGLAQILEPRSRHVAPSAGHGSAVTRSVKSFGQRHRLAAATVLVALETPAEERIALAARRHALVALGEEERRRPGGHPEPAHASRPRLALERGVQGRGHAAAPVARDRPRASSGCRVRRGFSSDEGPDQPLAVVGAPGRDDLVVAAGVLEAAGDAEPPHGLEVGERADDHAAHPARLPPADASGGSSHAPRVARDDGVDLGDHVVGQRLAPRASRSSSSARAAASSTSGRPSYASNGPRCHSSGCQTSPARWNCRVLLPPEVVTADADRGDVVDQRPRRVDRVVAHQAAERADRVAVEQHLGEAQGLRAVGAPEGEDRVGAGQRAAHAGEHALGAGLHGWLALASQVIALAVHGRP